MDSVGVLMWLELQFGSLIAESPTKRALLVWDNCAPHLSDSVKACLSRYNVEMKTLPPNTTSSLQVMDLCVNAPLKARIRRERCEALFHYFTTFQLRALYAKQQGNEPPVFNPPKPIRESILKLVFETVTQNFQSSAFKEAVQRVFAQVGLVADQQGKFRSFSSPGPQSETITYSEILSDTYVCSKAQDVVDPAYHSSESSCDDDDHDTDTNDNGAEQTSQPEANDAATCTIGPLQEQLSEHTDSASTTEEEDADDIAQLQRTISVHRGPGKRVARRLALDYHACV
jgi:hypothetical protein